MWPACIKSSSALLRNAKFSDEPESVNMKVHLSILAATCLFLGFSTAARSAEREAVKLFVREVPLQVQGREVQVVAIEQEDGTQGYSPQKDDGFHVEVVNELKVPTTLHWHGLIVPNSMDGVPFVTQAPIPPGERYRYDFPLKQTGTYWMHSHYGLQEQLFNSAPLIIRSPEEDAKADQEVVVMLSDFSFTPPNEILRNLQGQNSSQTSQSELMPSPRSEEMSPKPGMNMPKTEVSEMTAQVWDENAKTLGKTTVSSPPVDIDVHYDALLANRRTLDDPEIVSVKAGSRVLLRLIAASSATNFYIDTGVLDAQILAVDGQAVQPLKGSFFQLGIAQRLDLLVTIPEAGGAFPILAQGEGTTLLAGIVLVTKEAAIPKLATNAALKTAALDNTQEQKLRALSPLPERPVDLTLPVALGGDMARYVWTINGEAYPNRNSLDVKAGQRVALTFTNQTMMPHPMHLHGHDFQVVEIDGALISGAMRDTVVVPPKSTIRVIFQADNAGIWALHCHLLYHLATGMFTVVKYEGVETPFWQPEKTPTELQDGR